MAIVVIDIGRGVRRSLLFNGMIMRFAASAARIAPIVQEIRVREARVGSVCPGMRGNKWLGLLFTRFI